VLEAVNRAILTIADPLLGWMLRLPSDVALVLLAVGTGTILTFARLFTTNQDLLRRCSEDKRRLKELLREAKRGGDRDALTRYRSTRGMIAMKTIRAEGLPLLVAVVPIAVLGTWAFQRLEFVPPAAGEPVPLVVYFPVSAAGRIAHLVPQDGVTAEGGWVREIVAVTDPAEGPPHATATWRLVAEPRPEPYRLEIRFKQGTYSKELLVGQPAYAAPVEFYPDQNQVVCSEIQMQPVKLLGIVPGVPWLGLAPRVPLLARPAVRKRATSPARSAGRRAQAASARRRWPP
jgi:uncharacterized membrane protein (DUF106 family)